MLRNLGFSLLLSISSKEYLLKRRWKNKNI
ncbi:hypothetical protein Ocin01_13839 [Orchesella cincta]|uniref:Uncharacterized protein n=1 Tax=Orchesella cincta TaxID=48709 RepID=A0A1D2MIW8_ORCCI|nr:hypothetical protein Ocin01_13839 [Orchesella cincta]